MVVEGDERPAAARWGDVADLVALLDVEPAGEGRFTSTPRGDASGRPVVYDATAEPLAPAASATPTASTSAL